MSFPLSFRYISTSDRPAVVVLADLTTTPLHAVVVNETEIHVDAPRDLIERIDELERQYALRLALNEATLAPRLLRPTRSDDRSVELRLSVSNYARFRASADIIAGYTTQQQIDLFAHHSTAIPPWLGHAIGVNCTLETADGKFLWTQRSNTTLEDNRISVAMSEGATPWDLHGNDWSPEITARRGFHEELGFSKDSDDTELEITFTSLIAQFGNGGLSVTGHAKTSLELHDVLVRRNEAIDRHEHENGLFVCDADSIAFQAFIDANPLSEWTTWGINALHDLARTRLHVTLDDIEFAHLPSQLAHPA